jgi:DNA-binding CsgD family transcriptional regulator
LNLRWLSRLHWYLGEKPLADKYVNEAVALMERLPPSAEKAWVTSVRSQMYMLTDDTTNAVLWGERAAEMARQLQEEEILCHALNNVGTAMLFAHNLDGKDKLVESLQISLNKGYHEQTARAFNNLSEYLVVFKQYILAEQYLTEGIAFDTKHDLDSWTYYLQGWQAQLRFEQGRYVEAEEIASRVLGLPHLTAIMKLPAMTVIGRLNVRTGNARGKQMLEAAMALALPLEEPQRVVPLACALAEAAWLASDNQACLAAVEPALHMIKHGNNPWELGELAVWCHRAGTISLPLERYALPYRYEIAGEIAAAAEAWAEVGNPYEQALALAQGNDQQLLAAINLFDELGAKPATKLLRDKAHLLGLRGVPRGPYSGVKEHPLGLSKREVEVIQLIESGHTNAEIAKRLSRSERTVEHHISSLILKLGAKNRVDAVRRHKEFTLALKKREK